MKRSREQLIADAARFAAAQDDLAGRCSEDSQHWHHVALAMLLREMASALSSQLQGGK
jgi:hypothetical protein